MGRGVSGASGGIDCPSCSVRMQRRAFARRPDGNVDLDLCFDCNAIWFDPFESAALTPGAVIELFGVIHENRDRPPRPLGEALSCPSCRDRLQLTHDFTRTTRISYYRCPEAHGRLTTFFQFLNEKSFVRSLTPAEIERLRVTVTQVRCSSCGAPVDIGRDPQCSFCRSPVAVLDADAVRKTLAELDAAERKRAFADPHAIVDGLLAGQQAQRRTAQRETGMLDLVSDALDSLMRQRNGATQ